jgi:hypothetical protein
LATRALIISDEEHLEREKQHLTSCFLKRGYKDWQVKRVFQVEKRTLRARDINYEGDRKVVLPHFQGTSENIAIILRKKNIKTIFQPPRTIRSVISSLTDLIDHKLQKRVYNIPFSCGLKYIGETGRSFSG